MEPHTSSAVSPAAQALVIGYGNSLRADDGAGHHVAEIVAAREWPGISSIACDLLTPELADPISKVRKVIFVDATAAPQSGVQCQEIQPAASARLLGHHGNPATILAIAREVFGHAPRAWMLTIPAQKFEFGAALSEITRQGIEDAVGLIQSVCAPELSEARAEREERKR